MPRLERLRVAHGPAVLAFETQDRAWFGLTVTDRGDEFFEHFPEVLDRALAEQQAGVCVFHVLVDDDGAVIGRVNLYDLGDGAATVGYRVARRVAGRGVATAAVRDLCGVAAELGLGTLLAVTADENAASRRVLVKAGFAPDGPADPAELGGRAGTRFRRDLTVP